jgi:hypothetical protein
MTGAEGTTDTRALRQRAARDPKPTWGAVPGPFRGTPGRFSGDSLWHATSAGATIPRYQLPPQTYPKQG